MLSYTHIIFVNISFHHSDQSAASKLSSMSGSSESVAKLSIKSNSEYIINNVDSDDDSNADVDSPVSKKRKVACMTTGKTRGPASTSYPAAPAGHVYRAKNWLSHQPMIVQGSRSKCNFHTNDVKCNMHTNMICKLCQRHFCRYSHPTRTCWQDHIAWCMETEEVYTTSNVKRLGEHVEG